MRLDGEAVPLVVKSAHTGFVGLIVVVVVVDAGRARRRREADAHDGAPEAVLTVATDGGREEAERLGEKAGHFCGLCSFGCFFEETGRVGLCVCRLLCGQGVVVGCVAVRSFGWTREIWA